MRSLVYVLAQATKHTSTQCMGKSFKVNNWDKTVQLYMNKYGTYVTAA